LSSITKKIGASGKLSPYWRAKFRGIDGRPVWLTTKCRDSRKALAIAQRWEKAARLAESWELNQSRAQKILDEVTELCRMPATLAITKTLLDQLLRDSIGGSLAGQDFEVFAREWLSSKNTGKVAPSTAGKYELVIERFLSFLPERRRIASVASITAGEIERFRDAELKAGKSPQTANMWLAILRAIFNVARRQCAIATNPAEAVEFVQADAEQRVPFDDDQLRALLAVASVQWRGMILFGAHCGLRLRDAANLTWNNIDLGTRTLSYAALKTSRRKKASQRLTSVYLHGDVINYLEGLAVSDDPGQALFPDLHGRGSSGRGGLSPEFSSLMDLAGIRAPLGIAKTGLGRRFKALGFHSLRHSFISRLANAEVSSDVRREIVGHSNEEIHQRYVHLDLALQQNAIAKLSSLLL
jgi:integrase